MFKRDLDLEKRWSKLLTGLETAVGKKPKDLNGVLFFYNENVEIQPYAEKYPNHAIPNLQLNDYMI